MKLIFLAIMILQREQYDQMSEIRAINFLLEVLICHMSVDAALLAIKLSALL